MMINCPKCNLLQPKDQYCAGCGINMESWEPPKKPLLKKILSNWIFQLSLLFIIVLILVLKDSFFPPTKSKQIESPQLPSISRKQKAKTEQNHFAEKEPEKKVVLRSGSKTKKFKTTSGAKEQVNPKSNPQSQPLKKNINARIYLVPRPQIERLLSQGQKIDEGVGYILKEDFKNTLDQATKNWKRVDSIRQSFEFNRPKILFTGERLADTNKNVGFYFEVTVFDSSDNQNIGFELKSWNELRSNSGQEDALSYEMTLRRDQLVVLSGIVSREQVFSEEERALFDSSSSLQVLNNESFIEDYSDILLVLELN